MARDPRSIPKRLHCHELNGNRTGILILDDAWIELYFVGYGNSVHVSADAPVHVVTEEGEVVSLYANVPARHSSKSVLIKRGGKDGNSAGDEWRRVSESGVISNLALVGADAWRSDDLIRQLSFEVDHTEHVLCHREKLEALGRVEYPSADDLALYRLTAGDVILTAGYGARYDIHTRSLKAYRPVFSIEFPEGISLGKLEMHLARYLSFLSFVVGVRLIPKAVRADRLSFEEMIRAVEAGTYVRDHKVIMNWCAEEIDASEVAFHGAPFLAANDVELKSFEAGLAAWVNRSGEWERANVCMTESLHLRRVISGERLVAAWRWFEELPNARAERLLDDDAIEPLIRSALDAAHDYGFGDMENRIRGALRRIGEETMRERFARLLDSVRVSLGENEHLADMIGYLVDARRFRGRVAHGHFVPRDDAELRRFNKATLSMEALCFLLTARDLPMTESGKKRIWSHPVLQSYSLAFAG